jgi:hypothetical protein
VSERFGGNEEGKVRDRANWTLVLALVTCSPHIPVNAKADSLAPHQSCLAVLMCQPEALMCGLARGQYGNALVYYK